MEDYSPKESDSLKPADKLNPQTGESDFISNWKKLLNKETEEDETEESVKPKKLKKLFSFIFRKTQASNPLKAESSREESSEKRPFEHTLFGKQTENTIDDNYEEKIEDSDEEMNDLSKAETTEPLLAPQEQENLASVEPIYINDNNNAANFESGIGSRDVEADYNLTSEQAPALTEPQKLQVQERYQAPDYKEFTASTKPDLSSEATGVASIGSVLVDQLSRHRDRKLKSDVKKLKQDVKNIKQSSEQEKFMQPNQESQSPKIDEEVYKERAMEEQKQPILSKEKEVIVTLSHETKIKPDAPETPIFRTEKIISSAETSSKPTETTSEMLNSYRKNEKLAPNVVMEQVEAAAKKDIPIEAVFERRHEVKDDSINSSGTTTTQSVDIQSNNNSSYKSTPWITKTVDRKSELKPKLPPLYSKAVRSGFWTAVVIIAILLTILISKG